MSVLDFKCPWCGYRITKVEREAVQPHIKCGRCHKAPMSHFIPVPPVKTHLKCSKCQTVKPESDFYKDRTLPRGRCYNCIDCQKTYERPRSVMKKHLRGRELSFGRILSACQVEVKPEYLATEFKDVTCGNCRRHWTGTARVI